MFSYIQCLFYLASILPLTVKSNVFRTRTSDALNKFIKGPPFVVLILRLFVRFHIILPLQFDIYSIDIDYNCKMMKMGQEVLI